MNAFPVRIGDGVCPEDDVNLESHQERTNQDQPSEPMNPSNEEISNGNPSDEDVNPGGAQEAITQQEISQLFRELHGCHQTGPPRAPDSEQEPNQTTAKSNHRRPRVQRQA